MDKMDILIEKHAPYETGKPAQKAFYDALNECFDFHYSRNDLFRKNADFFGKKCPRSDADLPAYPYLFVDLFKSRRMCSVKAREIRIRLSSSGTGGRKSYHYLDGISLSRIKRIVAKTFDDHGLVSDKRCNYLCFTYDPKVAKDVGTAFSDKLLTGLTPRASVYYSLKFNDKSGEFEFNEQECVELLKKYQKSGLPLRILGFPAYLWKVLTSHHGDFSFPADSFVITGGGWKLHTGEEVPKQVFKGMIGKKLGIAPDHIVDTYGMVEHGIPYIDCREGNFHVPIYARVLAREPLSLSVMPYGGEGIAQLVSPYMHSFPAVSLLSTDRISMGEGCACGRKTPFFNILGRGGVKKHKGCAINAAELLARQEGRRHA
ncbi:MAG: hypothetical protein PHW04_04670 [Candidatus Wallbacteria bacterium]|nr:hypothetical protein [Candidatus Wallbacteria bacterium]